MNTQTSNIENEILFDRQGYIVIQKNDGEYEERKRFYICSESDFKEMPLSNAYENYGQQVGSQNAGDYIELTTEKSVDAANEYELENETEITWEIGDTVSACDNSLCFDYVVENCSEEDYSIETTKIIGYTFWDGHNHKTISISTDFYEPTHNRPEAELENEILKEFLDENFSFENGSAGVRTKQPGKYQFTEYNWQGHFETAIAEMVE